MQEIQVVTVLIVLLAVPFLVEAMRRGLGRALGAMAVMGGRIVRTYRLYERTLPPAS